MPQQEERLTKAQEVMYKLSKKFDSGHPLKKYLFLLFVVLGMGLILAGIFWINSSINMYVIFGLIMIAFIISVSAVAIPYYYYPFFLAPFHIRLLSVVIGFLSLYSFLFFFTLLSYKIIIFNPVDLFRILSGSYYTNSSIFGLPPKQSDISFQIYYSFSFDLLMALWFLFGGRKLRIQRSQDKQTNI